MGTTSPLSVDKLANAFSTTLDDQAFKVQIFKRWDTGGSAVTGTIVPASMSLVDFNVGGYSTVTVTCDTTGFNTTTNGAFIDIDDDLIMVFTSTDKCTTNQLIWATYGDVSGLVGYPDESTEQTTRWL